MRVTNESDRLLHLDKRSTDRESSQLESQTQSRPWVETLKGITASVLHILFHILGVTFVQLLQRRIPDLELQVFRCFGVVIACMIWLVVQQKQPTVPLPEIPALFLYAILVIGSATATYIGFALIPASAAQCAEDTSELFSGLFVFWVCVHERITPYKVVCVFLCIVGVVLVIQPWHCASKEPTLWLGNDTVSCLLQMENMCALNKENTSFAHSVHCTNQTQFGINDTTHPCESISADSTRAKLFNELHFNCSEWISCFYGTKEMRVNPAFVGSEKESENNIHLLHLQIPQKYSALIGYIFVVFAGVFYSLLAAVQKKSPSIAENIIRSLFWSFLFGFISNLALTFAVETPVWPESSFDTVAVFIQCVAAVGDWIFWVHSLQSISCTAVNVITCTAAVFLLVPQYTILASILPGQHNWLEVVGVITVLSGSVFVSVMEVFQT